MKNILILVPHINGVLTKGIIKQLYQNYNLIVLDFCEKDVEVDTELLGKIKERNFSKAKISYSDQNLINSEDSEIIKKEIEEICNRYNIEFIFSAKNRYEFLLSELPNLPTAVPSKKILELCSDSKQLSEFCIQNKIPVARILSDDTTEEYFEKPRYEYQNKRFGELDPSHLLKFEVVNFPEINSTVIVKDRKTTGIYSYQRIAEDDFNREIVENKEVNNIITDIFHKFDELKDEKIDGVYNLDFMFRGTTPVLNEINCGRLPAGHIIFASYNLPEQLIKYFSK
jgi:hypothetical protein